jgi:hypothetical protein
MRFAVLGLVGTLAACGSGSSSKPPTESDTAPTVTSTSPTSGSTVAVSATVSIVFSKAMNPSSVTVVAQQGTNANDLWNLGTGTWSNGNATLTFASPPVPLSYGQSYALSIDGNDAEGTALATAYASFTVEAQPAVTAVSPSGTSVPVVSPVSLQFNVPMDHTSTENAFSLVTGTTPVACLFSWSADSTIVNCAPSASLTGQVEYTVSLASTAMSALGDPIGPGVLPANFTTATHDTTPPTVVGRLATGDVGTVGGIGNITTTSPVTIVFSKAVNQAIAQAAFQLSPGGSAGTFSWDVTGAQMTFQPTAALQHGATETWTVAQGVPDLFGNTLAATATGTFHVVAEQLSESVPIVGAESGWILSPTAHPDLSVTYVGADGSNNPIAAFLSFDFTQLSKAATATAMVSGQLTATVTGTFGTTSALGTVYAESVDYASPLVGSDLTIATDSYGLCHVPVLTSESPVRPNLTVITLCHYYEAAFSAFVTGSNTVDVSTIVQFQWNNRATRNSQAQFRLEPTTVTGSETYFTLDGPTAAAAVPSLIVSYEYAW